MLEKHGSKLAYVASGTIRSNGDESLPQRLKTLYDGIAEVARSYAPDCAAIEKVFVNVNPQSTLMLGQARGAAIAACVARQLQVSEYAAREVKLAVVGTGGADKLQVQHMVGLMLGPAKAGLTVAEYSPNLIKKAVVGAGHADKSQIAFMVKRLLPTAGDVKADAADALAVAITHAHVRASARRMGVDVRQAWSRK